MYTNYYIIFYHITILLYIKYTKLLYYHIIIYIYIVSHIIILLYKIYYIAILLLFYIQHGSTWCIFWDDPSRPSAARN